MECVDSKRTRRIMPNNDKFVPKDFTFDVYGKTPFEHELTAEPVSIWDVKHPMVATGSWQLTTRMVLTTPALPAWMKTSG